MKKQETSLEQLIRRLQALSSDPSFTSNQAFNAGAEYVKHRISVILDYYTRDARLEAEIENIRKEFSLG